MSGKLSQAECRSKEGTLPKNVIKIVMVVVGLLPPHEIRAVTHELHYILLLDYKLITYL
jgi:hypothetical protein